MTQYKYVWVTQGGDGRAEVNKMMSLGWEPVREISAFSSVSGGGDYTIQTIKPTVLVLLKKD